MQIKYWLTLITLTAITLQFALIWQDPTRLESDLDSYLRLATNITNYKSYGFFQGDVLVPTAFRPPLYPLVLSCALLLGPAGIALLNMACTAVTILLTWHVCQSIVSDKMALLATALVALDPISHYYAVFPMTEPLASLMTILVISMALSCIRHPRLLSHMLLGVFLGVATLCRPTFLLLTPFLVLIVSSVDFTFVRFTRSLITFVFGLVIILLPWALRNWYVIGTPTVATTHGGYTLLLGNNQRYYDEVIAQDPLGTWHGSSLTSWQSALLDEADQQNVRGEIGYDQFCYGRAFKTIRANKGLFLKSCVVRVINFWRPMPHATTSFPDLVRVGCLIFYGSEFVLFTIALHSLRPFNRPTALILSLILSFTLVHSIYWSNMRMRAPLVPAIAILIVMGLHARIRRGRVEQK